MEKQPPAQIPRTAVHQRVQSQFGAAAVAYTTSAVHSDSEALRQVIALAHPTAADIALDIATGAGHTALALAPHVASVIAYDLTPEMLRETRRNAESRGITNLVTREGAAEALPFPDSSFDIVTVRQAPHHFADVRRAVHEMARVAKSGARLVIVDSTSPEDDRLDQQWNHIEKLRDPSHVRNYRPDEWRAMVTQAGLNVTVERVDFCLENGRPMDFSAWTRRMNTPAPVVEELEQLFRNASPELAHALRIQVTGPAIFFCVPQLTMSAVKA